MDASPLLADSCSGFWAPMQLLVLLKFKLPLLFVTCNLWCSIIMYVVLSLFVFITHATADDDITCIYSSLFTKVW